MTSRLNIRIEGIVQGVGMRPFVYSLAAKHGISGWVLNDSRGVEIEAEGPAASVEQFLQSLSTDAPALAQVDRVTERAIPPAGASGFEIRTSEDSGSSKVLVSPDVCVCEDCLREMFDPADRRYLYPFINCTNCGPRYTIIKDLPYDRDKTTMARFPMCEDCRREYEDPSDRRFHAQPVACAACGPKVSLLDSSGALVPCDDPIASAARHLAEGRIVAVKGLGGFHLAVDATRDEAVKRLRSRKAREEKPLAVMCQNVDAARRSSHVSVEEERCLRSTWRPIVLLRKKHDAPLAESVAPRNSFFGTMLPYTPLHELLLREMKLLAKGDVALVMTSGNVTDEPICHENPDAIGRLSGIADFFVTHDRDIYIRTDDSVARVIGADVRLSRRSRGYVPRPVVVPAGLLDIDKTVLAVGPELKNTACILRGHEAFLSHHIGDLKNLAAYSSLGQAVEHLEKILDVRPGLVACDLHPSYLSTRYAQELGLPVRAVQHHHAHIASCMAENGTEGPVIGVAFDGTGHGSDGTVWGGEFLVADLKSFRRAAYFEPVPMPGGDMAIAEPGRMALSYLRAIHGRHALSAFPSLVEALGSTKVDALMQMMEQNVNSPLTSSAGRLFDAVAALVGLRYSVSYEGQAACELEGIADADEKGSYPCRVMTSATSVKEAEESNDSGLVIAARDIVDGAAKDLAAGVSPQIISARFHNAVLDVTLDVVQRLRTDVGIDEVALSGGVWQNARLLSGAIGRLTEIGMTVHAHALVPTNDGGVSLGQAVVAACGGGVDLADGAS